MLVKVCQSSLGREGQEGPESTHRGLTYNCPHFDAYGVGENSPEAQGRGALAGTLQTDCGMVVSFSAQGGRLPTPQLIRSVSVSEEGAVLHPVVRVFPSKFPPWLGLANDVPQTP